MLRQSSFKYLRQSMFRKRKPDSKLTRQIHTLRRLQDKSLHECCCRGREKENLPRKIFFQTFHFFFLYSSLSINFYFANYGCAIFEWLYTRLDVLQTALHLRRRSMNYAERSRKTFEKCNKATFESRFSFLSEILKFMVDATN